MQVENNNNTIHLYDQTSSDEGNDSDPHGDLTYITFNSTPNIRIYLGNEDDANQIEELMQLTKALNLKEETHIKYQKKKYTIIIRNDECYIHGINTFADRYLNQQEFANDNETYYIIDGYQYINILKEAVVRTAQCKFRQNELVTGEQYSESYEERDRQDIQLKLLRKLAKYPCLTDADFVEIIGRKYLQTLTLMPLDSYLQQALGRNRLSSIIDLAHTQPKRG
jgi:hypothetical protein